MHIVSLVAMPNTSVVRPAEVLPSYGVSNIISIALSGDTKFSFSKHLNSVKEYLWSSTGFK